MNEIMPRRYYIRVRVALGNGLGLTSSAAISLSFFFTSLLKQRRVEGEEEEEEEEERRKRGGGVGKSFPSEPSSFSPLIT